MVRFLAASAALAALISAPAFGQASFRNASTGSEASAEASERAAEAAAILSASGVQVSMGAVAVPLALSGAGVEAAGASVGALGDALWDGANTEITIDDAVIVAAPPPNVPADPAAPAPQGPPRVAGDED